MRAMAARTVLLPPHERIYPRERAALKVFGSLLVLIGVFGGSLYLDGNSHGQLFSRIAHAPSSFQPMLLSNDQADKQMRLRRLKHPVVPMQSYCQDGVHALSTPPLPGKKGIGMTLREDNWALNIDKVKKLNVSWNYSWATKRIAAQPDNIEFIPMVWGKKDIYSHGLEHDIIPDFRAGRIHRFLAFNEPDHQNQSNMPVPTVLLYWPILEKANIPMASPSPARPLGSWSREFFQEAHEKCLRMEYTALHWYGAPNAEGFKNKMMDAYELYGRRPLLITEFAVVDYNALTPEQNKFSTEQVLAFMKEVIPWLEQSDFVAGYSWFNFAPYLATGSSSSLYQGKKSKELTACGRYYASVTPDNPMGDQSIMADDDNPSMVVYDQSATTSVVDVPVVQATLAPVPVPAV